MTFLISGVLLRSMTAWHGIIGFIAIYLILLARSAWIQGELTQYLRSLGVVLCVLAAIIVLTYVFGPAD